LASASQADTNEALIARVSLIPPSAAKRTTIDVFINCPYLSATTPLDDPHYLGTIAFFGARHGAGHSGHGAEKPVDYVLPLNQTLVNLAAAGKPVQGAIRVQLRAAAPGSGGQELDARLVGVTIGG
jgi:tyrosinase